MSKITLGKPPKTFAPATVKFPMPDGTEGAIECVFKYRSKKEFGAFIVSAFNTEAPALPSDMAEVMNAAVEKNAEYLVQVLAAWNLEEPLTVEAAAQLADEVPAAAAAIMQAYSRAVTEGRLGN